MTDTLAAQIETLAPCPFCGGESIDFRVPGAGKLWRLTCKNCDAGPHSSLSRDAAIAAWNRRIPAIVTALRQAEGAPIGHASDMAAALRNTPAEALRESGYLDRAADMLDAIAQQDMAAFGASDMACYEYPGEDQAKERAAFCAGAAHAVRQAEAAPGVVEAATNLLEVMDNFETGEVDYRLAIKDMRAALARQHGARD
jgi:Lar family restriction alleviation protein